MFQGTYISWYFTPKASWCTRSWTFKTFISTYGRFLVQTYVSACEVLVRKSTCNFVSAIKHARGIWGHKILSLAI